ncbi:YegP family protein [Autumnicola edwardsiae]|jgi:uncharacterized protein YegP (UPF0339 family)|uniref:YegP family protein n=1 Tax=Autumnicola edwardsiae TaxID=3075594 RepID=A0ABU3CSV9_9FLAO|nr:YegP family protein [Zunongwangia sp. F297]MDT0649318.1 YegP family protein [Zunongwangia sp. F297]
MGKFEIKTDKSGQYRFNLKARNGQIILSSEAYKTMQACKNGIESTRKNSQTDDRFEKKQVPTGHKFNLKATNGQIIGTSEVYTTVSGMNNGIFSVMRNAPEAEILVLN